MIKNIFLRKIQRFLEIFLSILLIGIPLRILGSNLRTSLYRLIFRKIGQKVYIQEGVEFIGSRNIEIGNGVWIHKGTHIDATEHHNNHVYLADKVRLERGVNICALDDTQILIGKGTFLGPYVCMAGPGNIKIGESCLIAAHTGIFANNHNFSDLTQDILEQGVTRQGIVIEDNCWLGYGVAVLDGVTIGKGSVIGAGSVVTKNIPPYSVAVGVPAKVIKSRKVNEPIVFTPDSPSLAI